MAECESFTDFLRIPEVKRYVGSRAVVATSAALDILAISEIPYAFSYFAAGDKVEGIKSIGRIGVALAASRGLNFLRDTSLSSPATTDVISEADSLEPLPVTEPQDLQIPLNSGQELNLSHIPF